MSVQTMPVLSTATTTAEYGVSLSGVGVRYLLLTEAQRTLKGRILSLLGSPSPDASFWALQNVTLTLKPGDVLGVVGRNGSGKSTLLRVMSGVIHPTTGSVAVNGQVSPLLELGAAFHGELTGRENAYLYGAIFRFSREQITEMLPQIVTFSELGSFFDIPIKAYSSGMVSRLAFAIATQLSPKILLIDEVLAVGDEQFQKKSFLRIKKLMDRGSIVVLVSHSSAMIAQLCNRAIYLSRGEIAADGRPAEVLRRYQQESAG